jgi:hypothetical protein
MTIGNLNYWPVLIATIVTFAFGAAWYTAFSKPWMAARGMSASDIETAKAQRPSMTLPFLVSLVALLIMAWMLAGVLLHLSRGGMPVTVRAGMISGFFLWLGFVITTMAVNHIYQGVKPSLTLIDGGHWLGVLLIQGAVLGWWGV